MSPTTSNRMAGFALAAAPTVAFVGLLQAADLATALIGTAVAAVIAFGIQLLRGEPLRAPLVGLLVALACGAVAALTGDARDFFLIPIAIPAAALVVCIVTILARRPLTGLLLNRVSGGPRRWYDDRELYRIHTRATAVATLMSLLNGTLQSFFYLRNQPVVLGAIHVLVAPTFWLLVAGTVIAVRRELGRRGGASKKEPAPSPAPASLRS